MADKKVKVHLALPTTLLLRLDWLVEHMQYNDPSVCRSNLIARFITEKLNENKVPMIEM